MYFLRPDPVICELAIILELLWRLWSSWSHQITVDQLEWMRCMYVGLLGMILLLALRHHTNVTFREISGDFYICLDYCEKSPQLLVAGVPSVCAGSADSFVVIFAIIAPDAEAYSFSCMPCVIFTSTYASLLSLLWVWCRGRVFPPFCRL